VAARAERTDGAERTGMRRAFYRSGR